MVYSENGLNGMSQTFHRPYIRSRLAQRLLAGLKPGRSLLIIGKPPTSILHEEKILNIASRAATELGIELFVLG